MYSALRPLLFRLDPETAHNLTLRLIGLAGRVPPARMLLDALYRLNDPRLEVEAFGIRFKNPVGLAAGYDKNGVAVRGLVCLGFGHLEVGTVTRGGQVGNPRPRVWRVPQARALVNRMGFPNAGAAALNLPDGGRRETRLGINIGKRKDTPLERAGQEYAALLNAVYSSADYVALNISSPNTPGLRQLQQRAAVQELLGTVTRARNALPRRVPVLVKIAPDLAWNELDDVLAAVEMTGVDGVIATNTTLRREGLPESARGYEGGMSGAPLCARSTEIIRYIARQTEGRLPVIGVGGILSADDAIEKLRAGARLVQLYTGLVYAGPGLVRAILARLLRI